MKRSTRDKLVDIGLVVMRLVIVGTFIFWLTVATLVWIGGP